MILNNAELLKLLEPLTRVWHDMGHPGNALKDDNLTCSVCGKTFYGNLTPEEYEARERRLEQL